MAFRLSIEDGAYVQTLEVRTGSLTVGRKPPNGLALSSPGLSERHAVFRQVDDRVEVQALPTKIGVRMGNDRIERELLRPGQTVHVGWAKITVVEVTPETSAQVVVVSPPAAGAAAVEWADEPRPMKLPTPAAASGRTASTAPAMPSAEPPLVFVPQYDARTAAQIRAALEGDTETATQPATSYRPPAEPELNFVVLSRRAVRALPWWGISVALHALVFGGLLLLPKPDPSKGWESGATFAVSLRQKPPSVEPEGVPVTERDAAPRDTVPRPDAVIPMDVADSNLPPSANPRGQGGVNAPRADDTGLVFDDGGGSPWAKPGGSTAIGVGVGAKFGGGVGASLDEAFGKGDAERANAAAAGKLNGDAFTRSLVDGVRTHATEQNVKVVPGDYDHGELVMAALGLHYGVLTGAELARMQPSPEVRAIFYNCTGRPAPPAALANLAQWVQGGGWLLTTDWGIDNVVEKAFPGYVKVARDGMRAVMTPDETITFTIAPGRHPLLEGLPPEAESARWWLEDSSILFTVEKPELVEVLAVSADLDRKHNSKFVAVTFKHGKGRVVHVLGHMYQKEGNLRGAYAMQRLLINFLYRAIKDGR